MVAPVFLLRIGIKSTATLRALERHCICSHEVPFEGRCPASQFCLARFCVGNEPFDPLSIVAPVHLRYGSRFAQPNTAETPETARVSI